MTWLVCVLFLVPATAACLYYLALTTLGWRRSAAVAGPSRKSFAVVIPAHDEELGLPATLRSVFASEYPRELVHVLVIADNCTDRTAAVARENGAECLERVSDTERGKGYALAVGIPHALQTKPDAVVILDADCDLAPDVLRRFAVSLTGAESVQAARVPRNPGDGPAALVSAVGSAVENAVSAGRDRLGLSAALRGSGMAFARDLLARVPWSSFGLTEDAEYGAQLARAGVRVRFLADAVVTGEVPADAATLAKQRQRWRAAVWAGGPGLLGRWLASKPLVLTHLAATVAVCAGLLAWLPVWVPAWAGVLVALTGVVYVRAMRRAGVAGVGGVAQGAAVVARLAWVTLAGAADRGRPWERTRRAAEAGR